MTLESRVAALAACGTIAVAAVAASIGVRLGLGAAYPWKAALLFLSIVAVAGQALRGHPFPRLGPANRVTFFRAGLLALVAAFIGEPAAPGIATAAVLLAVLAEVLDGFDGWLARRTGMASRFGARLDMETDALLIMVLSILVWLHGKAGIWVLAGGLMRYAFIAAGWTLPWMSRPLKPTKRAQTIAVTHEIGLNVALAPIIPMPFSAFAAAVTLLTLAWSFAVDVGRLWRNEGGIQ